MTSDQELVRAFLRRREERPFRDLYRRHTPALFRVAWRLIGIRQDAEDIVQETWVRAAEALPRFAWRSSLRTWLAGIVVNLCRELGRARGRISVIRHSPEVARNVTIETQDHVTQDRVDLERAISRLPAGYREVVVLHEIEGYTHKEIGLLLGIDEGTSKSQLHHARDALRGLFQNQGGAS